MEESKPTDNTFVNSKKKYMVILFVLLLLSIPLVFLFRKRSSAPIAPAAAANVDIAVLERAVAEKPTYANLIDLSVGYINISKPGSAIIPLQQALVIKPQSAVAYNNLGVAYTMLKNYPMAIDACNKAIVYDSTFTLAKNNLKWALDEQRKVFANISRMEQVPQNDRDSSFYVELGLSYYYVGNYPKSLMAYEEGLVKTPHNSILLNNTGTTLVTMRRYDEALRMFSQVLNIDASNQLAKNNIIWTKSEQAQDSLRLKRIINEDKKK